MSALTVSGGIVKSAEITRSWGLTPGSATLTLMGLEAPVTPGTTASFALGGSSFVGVVHDSKVMEDEGRSVSVSMVDNRIRMTWDTVYCSFNVVEILEDDLATPGIDRKKRYVHVLPADWEDGLKTYTDEPYTASQIMTFIAGASTVKFSWSIGSHAKLSKKIKEIDAMTGKEFGNVFQEICDAVGLQFTVTGSNSIEFSVKGVGSAPVPSNTNSTDRQIGEALGPKTRVRVVGDRNLRQILSIDLAADWHSHYEAYWFKPTWVARVKTVFGITDHAEAEARAREVTLREYITESGVDAADYGKWSEVSRMDIPVWIYITDIVWKSYKLPSGYAEQGWQLREGLLGEVENNEGTLVYVTEGEDYPEAKAFVIAQGQPLDFKDPKILETVDHDDLSTVWQKNNRFNIDAKNHRIVFEEITLKPRTGAEALFLRPNALTPGAPQIVVPNAGAVVDPAPVKGSFCFEAERFAAWFGSGLRDSSIFAGGLSRHLLYSGATLTREIAYSDNEQASVKAEEIADAWLTGQEILQSGGFTRHGVAGMALNGAIDRVTARLNFSEGGPGEALSEHITYAKERSPLSYETERELQRRAAAGEASKKIRELKEEADQIRLIGKLQKPQKRQSERVYENLGDIANHVVGNTHCSPVTVLQQSTSALPVGAPVRVKDDNKVDSEGTFKGIVIASGCPAGEDVGIPLATKGIVPVRARAQFVVDEELPFGASEGVLTQLFGCTPVFEDADTQSVSFAIPSPIKDGDLLFQYGSENYVTSFNFAHLMEQVLAGTLAQIKNSITALSELSIPSITPPSVTAPTFSITPSFSFPSLNISLPSVNVDSFDACDPFVSGGQAILDAYSGYDFTSAFTALQTALASAGGSVAVTYVPGDVGVSAFAAALKSAIETAMCQIATIIDDVIMNIDKIINLASSLIQVYLDRQPVGVAKAEWNGEGIILMPVNLDDNRASPLAELINGVVDAVLVIVKDVIALAIVPLKLAMDLARASLNALVSLTDEVYDKLQTHIEAVINGLAAGIDDAMDGVKTAAVEIIGVIRDVHAQVKSMIVEFATANKELLETVDLILFGLVQTGSNMIIDYINHPWIASPKIYLVESPFDLENINAEDWCDLVAKLTIEAAKIPGMMSIPSEETLSYLDNHNLVLLGPGDTDDIRLRVDDLADKGTAQFREIERCDGKRAMVLMTPWYDPEEE